ncbi:MAG: hypothetical protein HOP09_07920 [Hyphomicrobium sp.]|nr:hypothetical protein [Hyphomicrobium sp.]
MANFFNLPVWKAMSGTRAMICDKWLLVRMVDGLFHPICEDLAGPQSRKPDFRLR